MNFVDDILNALCVLLDSKANNWLVLIMQKKDFQALIKHFLSGKTITKTEEKLKKIWGLCSISWYGSQVVYKFMVNKIHDII